jgi:two-component system, cell cycle sensor histidine kinase and response regulator CckA
MGQPRRVLNEPSKSLNSALFSDTFDASPEGLALASNGRILHANAAFASVFGYVNPGEIAGRALAEFRVDADSYDCVRISGVDAARTSNGNPLCEFRGRRKDGSSVRMESTCSAFSSGGRKFVVLTVRDISQRERRRIIRDSDRRFRAIFEAAPMGIVQCDLEGRILEPNPAIERMLGYSREELRGMLLSNLTLPEDADRYARAFQELVQGKRDTCELEIHYLGKGDTSGWIHLKVSLVRGPEGDAQFAIAMAEDITERKRSEQRLREAQKMEVVGRLVGGVAHDFNNLLTGILLYCDLLVAGLQPGSRLRHHAEEIRMAGEQGAALIQQLLAISRQQVVEPRVLCLNHTIADTRNLLSRLIGENIELCLQLDKRLGNVKMDPAQLQQILFNLVLNARDAIAASGRIVVETSSCEIPPAASAVPPIAIPGVMLAVTDTGCGMSAETRSHLFEPFFTTKTPGRGNGLGLATVFGIVKNNGGTIQVESEPGKGSRFTVRLPRIPDPPIVHACEPSFSPVSTGETVLLVEDNLTVRKAANRILSECGYRVLEAATGVEAINVARAHRRDVQLLVADLVMPGMSGRELGRMLRAERPEMRILYMSGYEPRDSGIEEDGEPVVFFRKPFTGAALLEKVRQILDATDPTNSTKSEQGKREQP